MPGVSSTIAQVIIAETGGDMTQFPSAAHLASWAGVCPGHNESAGTVKSSHTRPGNHYLKGALGIAAMAAARTNGTHLQSRYKRLAGRRGPTRALVATEHSMLISMWHMLTARQPYEELGPDYFLTGQSRAHPSPGSRTAGQLGLRGDTDTHRLTPTNNTRRPRRKVKLPPGAPTHAGTRSGRHTNRAASRSFTRQSPGTCADPSRRFCGECWRAGLITRDDRLTTASAVEPRRRTPGLLLWLKQRPGSGDGLWDRAGC
jgi:hypothetical protein